jgi:hypothetical protein
MSAECVSTLIILCNIGEQLLIHSSEIQNRLYYSTDIFTFTSFLHMVARRGFS